MVEAVDKEQEGRVIRNASELHPEYEDDIRRLSSCSAARCSQPPTTLHWLPYVIECKRVELACADHDPGGYWMNLPLEMDDLIHVSRKYTGPEAVAKAIVALAALDARREMDARRGR